MLYVRACTYEFLNKFICIFLFLAICDIFLLCYDKSILFFIKCLLRFDKKLICIV